MHTSNVYNYSYTCSWCNFATARMWPAFCFSHPHCLNLLEPSTYTIIFVENTVLCSNVLLCYLHYILLKTRCTCMPCRYAHITVSRRGTCFWDGRPCATKCGQCEDGKEYMYKWVWGSERGSNTSLKWSFLETVILCFASCCSLVLSISLQTSRSSGCILALCFRFRFRVSLLTLITANFDVVTMRPLAPLRQRTIHLRKCTQLFVNRIF